MSQHTPGPFGQARVEGSNIVIPCSGVGQAAYCLRLARAAPELLTALEGFIRYADEACAKEGRFSTADPPAYVVANKARGAIAKVKEG
jgi:hypothetical protein